MSSQGHVHAFDRYQLIGLVMGLFLFLGINLIPAPEAVGEQGWRVIAVVALMLSWWVSEAVPIPVTALMPVVLFPTLEIMPVKQVTASYGNHIVFLFLGGFIIALALEKWKLHLRIALYIVRLTGTHALGIIAGFMIATAFLSMWVSNTATTVMMLPIAMSVLQLINKTDSQDNLFAICLLLSIAFAANIGGTATIIGTPPNAILAGFLSEQYQIDINFGDWFLVGAPFMVTMLALCWLLLTRLFGIHRLGHINGMQKVISDQWRALGTIGYEEKIVAVIFVSTALLWIFRSVLPVPGINDTSIAILAALSFFFIPSKTNAGSFLLTWEDSKSLPWGILLLFGGGINVASAMSQSGLVQLIGDNVSFFHQFGFLYLAVAVVMVVIFLTECMSNLALITMMLPVIIGISLQFDANPMIMAVGATLASSCAFMLPMATPPNAIVFSSGHIRVKDMVKAGVFINIVAMALITVWMFSLIPAVFDLPISTFTRQ